MDRGGTRHYRLLAEILSSALAADLNSQAKARAAGRAWGRRLESPPEGGISAKESIERLVELLDELGFAPERRAGTGEQQIGLRHCPFLELAENQTAVVCQLHLGLMQGAMETLASPVSIGWLQAFVEPDLCVAHLTEVEAEAEGFTA